MTKGDFESLRAEAEQTKADNLEYQSWRDNIQSQAVALGDHVLATKSSFDVRIQELEADKAKFLSYGDAHNAGLVELELQSALKDKAVVDQHTAQMKSKLEGIKNQMHSKAVKDFQTDARKELGANWQSELQAVQDYYEGSQVLEAIAANPSIELALMMKDAMEARIGRAKSKEVTKKIAQGAVKPKSTRTTRPTNPAKTRTDNRKFDEITIDDFSNLID